VSTSFELLVRVLKLGRRTEAGDAEKSEEKELSVEREKNIV
jgi:hypothetical protein